jgi:[amino group carrier protein]-L-2-aminoadipate/L-glutamate 6-kinase
VTIVVKVGGAAGNSAEAVLDDLAGRSDWVLAHGGSEAVDRIGAALGRPAQYYTSPSGVVSRRSDAAHLEVIVLALAGEVQTGLVHALGRKGVRAVGLSGVDGGLIRARRKVGARAVIDGRVVHLADDLSGTVEAVDASLLRSLLASGIAPVVGPPAVTADGQVVNVDADAVAAAVAGALGASDLVLLTNVAGLLRDKDDPSTLIPRLRLEEIESVAPLAAGRMRKKLFAARDAVRAGVPRVVIAPSNVPSPVTHALSGGGTVIG